MGGTDLQTTVLMVPRWPRDLLKSPMTKNVFLFARIFSGAGWRTLIPRPVTCQEEFEWPVIEGVDYVPMDMLSSDFHEEMLFTKDWYLNFHQIAGRWHYDAVLNMRTLVPDLLSRILGVSAQRMERPLIVPVPVISSPYVAARVPELLKQHYFFPEEDVRIEQLMYVYGQSFIMRCPYEIELVRQQLLEWVKPSLVGDILKRMHWIAGFNPDHKRKMLEAAVCPDPKDKLWVMYAGRMAAQKNVPFVAEAMHRIASVENVRCMVHTQTREALQGDSYPEIRRFFRVEVVAEQEHEPYLGRLKNTEIFLLASEHDNFNSTMYEAWTAGCVVILRKHPWMKGLVPDNYPFFVNTLDEMVGITRWCLHNLDKAREKMAFIHDWIKDNLSHSSEKCLEIVRREMARTIKAWIEKRGAESFIGSVRGALTGAETLDEGVTCSGEASRSGKELHPFLVRALIKYRRGDYDG